MSVMPPITLGEVSVRSVVEIPRSSFATTSMLPDSTADAVARHHRWLRPHFWDEATNDLGSRIQSFVVRTPRTTVLIDTCVGNDKNREGSAPGLGPAAGPPPGSLRRRAREEGGESRFSRGPNPQGGGGPRAAVVEPLLLRRQARGAAPPRVHRATRRHRYARPCRPLPAPRLHRARERRPPIPARMMRIGISLTSAHKVRDPRETARFLVERTAAAHRAGLDSLFVGDHHATPGPYYQNVPIMGRLLAEWGDKPAGCLFLLPLWNPVLVAEQIGTLAAIARGRFVLQAGLGYDEAQFLAMGANIKQRPSAFEESLGIIRRLLPGEAGSSDHRFHLENARLALRPA